MAFAGLLMDFLQHRLEGVPVHDPIQSHQGIAQPFQLSKAVFGVEEAWLRDVLRTVFTGRVKFYQNQRIFRGVLK